MRILRSIARRCCSSTAVPPNTIPEEYLNRPAEPLRPKKPKSKNDYTLNHFVDFKRITLQGGNGGDGFIHFRHIKYVAFAGPDGGDGGNGGHVIVQGDSGVKSLNHLDDEYTAVTGTRGGAEVCHGANAQHLYLKLPIGTILSDPYNDVIVKEIKRHGELFVAARGGGGGHGNHYFASPTETAPDHAEPGGVGETREFNMTLRFIAHAGFVGYPNVGKSSLLRAISRARPKVAAYPFTTLNPYVGVVDFEDHIRLSFADIPGILPGFHDNPHFGQSFLKHVERCICLIYVIDMSLSEPYNQLEELKMELEVFQEGLSKRPTAIVANKIDVPGAMPKFEELKRLVEPMPVFPISSARKSGVRDLLLHVRNVYDDHRVKWFDEGVDGEY